MARKKISIEPIPFLLFLLVISGLVFGIYYGVFSDFQSRKIKRGSEKFFLALDNNSSDKNMDISVDESLKRIFYSIDREAGVDGRLTEYGYCNVLEDYLKSLSSSTDSASIFMKETVLKIIKIEESNHGRDQTLNTPLIDELKKSIKNKDYSEALSYLEDVETHIVSQRDEIKVLNDKNKWMTPISFCAIFFVFFYGLNQVVKIK